MCCLVECQCCRLNLHSRWFNPFVWWNPMFECYIPSVVGEIHLFSAISRFLVGDIWNPPSFRHKNGDPLLLPFRLCLSSLGLQQLGNLIKTFLTKHGKRSEYVWGSFDVWLLGCQAMDTSGWQWDDSYIIIGYKTELYVLWSSLNVFWSIGSKWIVIQVLGKFHSLFPLVSTLHRNPGLANHLHTFGTI